MKCRYYIRPQGHVPHGDPEDTLFTKGVRIVLVRVLASPGRWVVLCLKAGDGSRKVVIELGSLISVGRV